MSFFLLGFSFNWQPIYYCWIISIMLFLWIITADLHPPMLTPSIRAYRQFLFNALDCCFQCSGSASRLILYSFNCLQQGRHVGHHHLTEEHKIWLTSKLHSSGDGVQMPLTIFFYSKYTEPFIPLSLKYEPLERRDKHTAHTRPLIGSDLPGGMTLQCVTMTETLTAAFQYN